MKVRLTASAERHLAEGYAFYEEQDPGAGDYFFDCDTKNIEDLARTGGIHPKHRSGYHRMVCRPHPYAVFYESADGAVIVRAVLDCRRRPGWILRTLRKLND